MGTKKSNNLAQLFEQTKLVAFGRFVLRVPLDTKINFGTTLINDGFEVYPNQGTSKEVRALMNKKWADIKFSDSTAELIEAKTGPVPGAEYFAYYDSGVAKKSDNPDYYGVVPVHGHAFVYKGGGISLEDNKKELHRQFELIKHLRYRKDDELPKEPGVCLPFAFVKDETYSFQERFDAGIYIPSLPDVRFYVSCNVMAYDGEQYSLLNSIRKQKDLMGSQYPHLTVFREGKKSVGVWDGEESLTRNKEGVHEFDWKFMGKQRSVAFPGTIEAGLRTKVADNMTGAAKTVSISDEEAIELWDMLLGNLAFRVPIPGASRAEMEINQLTFHPGDISPLSGFWQAIHPKLMEDTRQYYIPKGTEMLSKTWFSWRNLNPDEVVMKLIKVTPDEEKKG